MRIIRVTGTETRCGRLDMIKMTFFRFAALSMVAVAASAVPVPAVAAVLHQAEAFVRYLDEIAAVAALIGGLILIDTVLWPFMTKSR
jgi:uncharacterized membrane protein